MSFESMLTVVLCVTGLCFAGTAMAQIDPVCSLCAYKTCTYEKTLSCSCTGSKSGSVTITGFTDKEYSQVSLGFAIDDTGSMGGVINSVKSTILNVVLATAVIFDKFVLATFNDPYVYNLIESADTVKIKTFVDATQAHDGGDCPEMALTGIKDVANRVTIGSAIFLFTDASAKDFALEADVKALLLLKDIRLNVIAVGNLCGSGLGSELYRLANATGGSVYYTPLQYDVEYVMNYIAKYAKYGVRYIRCIPKSLSDLKILVDGTCSCSSGAPLNLVCVTPSSFATTATTMTAKSAATTLNSWHRISGTDLVSTLHWVLMAVCKAYVSQIL